MSTQILAPMPGTIVNILVSEGDDVLEYQEVVMLEAMKMENPIPTPRGGKVKSIKVAKGDTVGFEQILMEIE
jgi:acetyl-CoA carboxylase biotin carboxyl carrier protein